MNIEWNINKFNMYAEYKQFTNVVHSVIYTVSLTGDNGQIASTTHFAKFNVGDLSTCIPFSQLTKDTVIDWIGQTTNISELTSRLVEMTYMTATSSVSAEAPWL